MIGTNDVAAGYADTAVSRLSTLISHISNKDTGYRPNARLIVASIPPIGPNPVIIHAGPLVPAYNAGVQATVLAHQALGEKVTFLDMNSYLTVSDLGDDNLHPTPAGYDKISGAWKDGIVQAVPEPAAAVVLIPTLGLLMRVRSGK